MAKKKTARKTTRKVPAKQAGAGNEGRDSLGRFLPGVSGNPAGSQPGIRVADVIRRTLAERPEQVAALVESWLVLAATDVQFAKMLLERNEGKVADVVQAAVTSTTLTPQQHEQVMATLSRLTEQDPND